MRDIFVDLVKNEKEVKKINEQKTKEDLFKKAVDNFRKRTVTNATNRILTQFDIPKADIVKVQEILNNEINTNAPDMGIKSIIDQQKKKILISQTYKDKDLADIVYSMLLFNNISPEEIIYSNCDDELSRIPEDVGIYNYLRDFFVNSYSTQKMYVIFITSNNTQQSWGALTEVGAAWITQIDSKIFNIRGFRPEHPLNDETQWQTTCRDEKNELYMDKLNADIFCTKIESVCDKLGFAKNDRKTNMEHLKTLVRIK